MSTALPPGNWLDWCIFVYAGLGLVAGYRRGFILSVVAIAAAAGGLACAVHFAPAVAALATSRWHTEAHVEAFFGRVMPLPDGAGQTPYSTSAAALLAQQIARSAPSAYANSLASMVAVPPPPGIPAAATLGAYVDQSVAIRIVQSLAFAGTLLVAEGLLLVMGRAMLGGIARHGAAGLANAGLGAGVGLLERMVQVMALLAFIASLSVVPTLGVLAGALHRSHWAPIFLSALRTILPLAERWMGPWLVWP